MDRNLTATIFSSHLLQPVLTKNVVVLPVPAQEKR